MSIPKCLVLLSTYNGEKYIEEQLDSLLKQEGIELDIIIRDDGSKDSTIPIINHIIENSTSNIRLLKANNLGAKNSFFELIKKANEVNSVYDFYSFCDQDDVWCSNKLQNAINVLRNEDQNLPLMYCSTTQMVDSRLSHINKWPSPPIKNLSIYNALVENVAVGCTTVLNRKALELIASSPPDDLNKVIMHDWWAYLCISTFGKVIFDKDAYILYRQHSDNVLGGQTDNWISKWKKRFYRYFRGQNHYIISNQAKEFYRCYHNLLDEDKRRDLQHFIQIANKSGWARFIYAVRTPFYRQATPDHYILKLIICMGKI